jgi:hypothetical protein
MHARPDNPELKRAQELNIPIYSFPEFIYEQSRDKQRIVIGGSHGKTSITSIIMHVLRHLGRKFDYAVGAQLEGFDRMVKLTADAPIIIIEGGRVPLRPDQAGAEIPPVPPPHCRDQRHQLGPHQRLPGPGDVPGAVPHFCGDDTEGGHAYI